MVVGRIIECGKQVVTLCVKKDRRLAALVREALPLSKWITIKLPSLCWVVRRQGLPARLVRQIRITRILLLLEIVRQLSIRRVVQHYRITPLRLGLRGLRVVV